MAGTGVGKFSSTAGNNTSNLTVNFAENMAPSNVNNAARELMGHIRDMYEQLGDGYFEFGDGDATYTVARSDADTITISSSSDLSGVYFAGRKIRITDGGANVVEGTIASSSHTSSTQTVNLTGISLASGTPTKVELGIDTAAFGGRVILDDDGDTYIEAVTDDTIDIYVAGAKDFVITANTFTAESGSTIAAQTISAAGNVDFNGDLDVDGTTNLDVVDIDGAVDMASTLQVDGAITSSTGATITVTDNSDTLTLKSTDTDADIGPNLRLYRAVAGAASDAIGTIDWAAQDVAGNLQDYASAAVTITDATDGSEDGTLTLKVMNAGALNQMLTISGPETVVNEGSKDHDFRVETNGLSSGFHIDGGNNGIGIGIAPRSDLHASASHVALGVKGSLFSQNTTGLGLAGMFLTDNMYVDADTGAFSALTNDQCSSVKLEGGSVIIEGSTNTPSAGAAPTMQNIASFSNSEIVLNESSADVDFRVESNNQTHMFFIDGGAEFVSTGDTAPDVSRLGLCLNQAGNDGNIFTLKSSDVAHGVTDLEETDTFFSLRKFGANDGGVQMRSIAGASSNCGLFIDTVAGAEDTGKGTGDHGCTNIDAQKDNGTDKTPLASNGNLLTVSNDNSVKFILDAEGDIHVDGSSSISTYDTYEDAHLVRAYDLTYGQTSKGLINSKFDKFINYNHDSLVEAGIIGVPNKKENEDGTEAYGLLNSTAMQRLHNGAIWQQYEKTERLANAMYELAKAAVGEEKANEILKQNEIKLLN